VTLEHNEVAIAALTMSAIHRFYIQLYVMWRHMLYNIIAFTADAYISIVTCWIVSRFKQVFCNRLQKSSMAVLMDDVFYVINGDLLINNLFW